MRLYIQSELRRPPGCRRSDASRQPGDGWRSSHCGAFRRRDKVVIMEPFKELHGLVVPLDRANVDTDAITPKQFIKSIYRTGFGPFLFDDWRYLDRGELGQDCSKRPLNPDFPLNQARFKGASILLARENFGCGSSREHAAWALLEFGFRVVIAPSFGDIFRDNCYKNGMLPISLPSNAVDSLFRSVNAQVGFRVKVDLDDQLLAAPDMATYRFEIDPFRRNCLLHGLDDIAVTLTHEATIQVYERRRRSQEPWLFAEDAAPPDIPRT